MTGNFIGTYDVLCGRGGATNNHIGNKRFRVIVGEFQKEYLAARKKEKAVISSRIVERIKENGGRFLKRDALSDTWVEVSRKKAIEKTSQALREGLDVRHKTIRPEKMPRRDSDSSHESPRKRARLVQGKVASPSLAGLQGDVPALNDEEQRPSNVRRIYFLPAPAISRADCGHIAEV